MTILEKTPNTINQTTGGNFVEFTHLDNLRNTTAKSYAVSTSPLWGKNSTALNRPSTVTCTNYQFNIPANSVVKKIVVHYRHSRRGIRDDWSMAPASYKHRPNIKAPTITLTNLNVSQKGAAPGAGTGTHQTLTFTGVWNASSINSSNFGVKIDYPQNANNKMGYVLLGYCYIAIDYIFPNYGLTASSANSEKVYNKQDYHLKIQCSDSNTTGLSPTVNISLPTGFTYKEFHGNGNVILVPAHTLTWYPAMNSNTSSQTVELVMETDVSFSGTSTSATFTFTAGIANTTISAIHTGTIHKELPTSDTEEDDSTTSNIDDNTSTVSETIKAIIGETLTYEVRLSETEYQAVIDYWNGIGVTNLSYMYLYTLFRSSSEYDQHFSLADLDENYSITQTWTPNTLGLDTLELYNGDGATLWRTWKVLTIPTEASLTVPNYSTLQLTEEELNRIGDGYTYVMQSHLQLSTSETYVRDWYKNFRIGVFNNRIEANCTEYYQYDNTGEEFDGYLIIPGKYDITDAYITLSSDNDIVLNINDNDYTITSTATTIQLFELYNLPVIYTKSNDDNVVITLTLYDSEDTQLYTMDYHINFNADETTDLTPVTVDTTDYSNLTDAEIFSNAAYWSSGLKEVNTWESLTCEFTYDEDYPLYFLFTGDYPEGDQSNNNIKYLEPCIVEEDQFTERVTNGTYPNPIDDLVLNDGSTSELLLTEYSKSDTIVFYDLPLDENYGTNTNMAIRGIELTGNIEQTDQLVLYSKLKSPNGESRERSILLNDYDTVIDSDKTFSIGGNGDLWGFTTLDMTNMEDWECELTVSNVLNEAEASMNFGDVHLIFHIETVDQQDTKVYIEGEDVAYYGVFVTDVTVPEGLETDTDYLSVDGTDTNDAYRQNIKEKTIEIEFEIGDNCDLTEATESLRQFTKLLVNERDEYNRPIPKRLELSHYPDVYWEYIMEETMDTTLEISSYKCKAKLTIPDGTSYDTDITTTSNTGYVNGIAAINPTVIVRPIDTLISIIEHESNQQFSIGYTGGWENKILEIDCENRIVWLRENEEDTEPLNLNKYVDFNSDWFSIIGEYQFIGTGCVVRTVDIQERW